MATFSCIPLTLTFSVTPLLSFLQLYSHLLPATSPLRVCLEPCGDVISLFDSLVDKLLIRQKTQLDKAIRAEIEGGGGVRGQTTSMRAG